MRITLSWERFLFVYLVRYVLKWWSFKKIIIVILFYMRNKPSTNPDLLIY